MPVAATVQVGLRAHRSSSPPVSVPAGAPPRPCWLPSVFLPPGAASGWRRFSLSPLLFPPLRRLSPLSAATPPFPHPPCWRSSVQTPSPLAPFPAGTHPCLCPSPLVPFPVGASRWQAPPFWRLSLVVRLSGVALPWVCPSLVAPLPGGPRRRPSSLAPPPAGIHRWWRLSLVVPLLCAADQLWRLSLVAPFPGGPHWRPSPLAPPSSGIPAHWHLSLLCPSLVLPFHGYAPPWWRPSLLEPLPAGAPPRWILSLLLRLPAGVHPSCRSSAGSHPFGSRRWEHSCVSGNVWLHNMQKRTPFFVLSSGFVVWQRIIKNATNMVVYSSSKTDTSGFISLSLSQWSNQIKAFDDPGSHCPF